MIQALAHKFNKRIALTLFWIFYIQVLFPAVAESRFDSYISPYHSTAQIDFRSLINYPLLEQIDSFNESDTTAQKTITTNNNDVQLKYSVLLPKKSDDNSPGPGQPEMSSFQSVNSSDMVDKFSGDFSYNIPLMDVGGYPINISYRSGISMDQEASWVGLGWNINPGSITRNMRGVPDDFDGQDTIVKTASIKDNKTIGGTIGADLKIIGLDVSHGGSTANDSSKTGSVGLSVGAQLGFFHNTYKGWGSEFGLNASISAGAKGAGNLTAGLSLCNNTQNGLTITPSLSGQTKEYETNDNSNVSGCFSIAAPYNTRSGMQGLELSAGVHAYHDQNKNQPYAHTDKGGNTALDPKQQHDAGYVPSGKISFCSPSWTPSISLPYTSSQFSFTGNLGTELWGLFANVFASGYVSDQYIAPADQTAYMPVYGYLHYQDGVANTGALTDFNNEKDEPYRQTPAVPNIGIPSYTYDVFSITGEGTGGMFRAYRGDLGYVYDHYMQTRDASTTASIDIGLVETVNGGVGLNLNRSVTTTGPWTDLNEIGKNISFENSDSNFEATYFRNPGEMTINTKSFYDAIGDEDVVAVHLSQGPDASTTIATNFLERYRNKNFVGNLPVTGNIIKQQRDKRTEVISYLTAEEAENAGFPNYIENYGLNQFGLRNCNIGIQNLSTTAGLVAEYFLDDNFAHLDTVRIDTEITIPDNTTLRLKYSVYGQGAINDGGQYKSVRWIGRLKAPVSGKYYIVNNHDDYMAIYLNDELISTDDNCCYRDHEDSVNLVAGEYYNLRVDYKNFSGPAYADVLWQYGSQTTPSLIPSAYLSILPSDSFRVNNTLSLEKRVNSFRKPNHISEIDVLNPDGRRYVYGIPVYNLEENDVTFAVNAARGNLVTGLAGYTPGVDNTTGNQNGKDNYFSSEQMPAYAHSFLLTSILSPDYVDLTGNGITDDDMGDAIQFKYSKVCGIANPYQWRVPYTLDSVTYNEGLKSYDLDDKGSYSAGQKELWYLNSIESKNMIATFSVSSREDELTIDANGNKNVGGHVAQKLDSINLYNKVDFLKNGTAAIPIKTVHFEYSYELCRGMNQPINDSGKLTLKKIWFTYNGNNKGKKNPYIFCYHPNNPRYSTADYDRWGDYKSPLQNPYSSTGNFISNADYPYALQDSATAAYNAAAWTLNSIKLPSGGIIKVDYESDDYAYVQNKRAMQMFQVVGFAPTPQNSFAPDLYGNTNNLLSKTIGGAALQSTIITNTDNLYVFVRVPCSPSSQQDAYFKYLQGVAQLYFKLSVGMPQDPTNANAGNNENVPCYANIDTASANWYYAIPNTNIIRIKLQGIDKNGNQDANPGYYSPLAEAAVQYLRQNLPSKAYPGSENIDNLTPSAAVKLLFSAIVGMVGNLESFDNVARGNLWARTIDTTRSYVRLNSPLYRKYGGGLRVKRITIYDNWNAMTGQQEATYGQEYCYTTTKEINGVNQTISSGVASYEPMMENEENPFHLPVPSNQQVAPLAPVTLGYVELPYGETFFPSASVGYSDVKVRSIHYQNVRSANGYEETQFYTTYDFPTITDNSDITSYDYKPALANLLRINAQNYLTASQGFKVELNDMDGKLKSEATYPSTDSLNYISYTHNYYKVDDPSVDQQHLSNTAWTINSQGVIDTTSVIGESMELMTSMRQQESISNGCNVNLSTDLFNIPIFPLILILPASIPMPQREDMLYRAAATTKIVQRYGILDSVVHIDKGSKISTENLLYNSETGDVLLTRTKNEFEDPIYNFNYPSDWAYDGMGGACKNIDVVLNNITMRSGKIVGGLPYPGADTVYFVGGDEVMVNSEQEVGGTICLPEIASFPDYTKLWAVNSSELNDSAKNISFIDANGQPFTGNNISLKVIRSGRRNIEGSVGSVTTLANPLVYDTTTGNYTLVFNNNSKVVNASAAQYKQLWRVPEMRVSKDITTCIDSTITSGGTTSCNDTIPANYQNASVSVCYAASGYFDYSSNGALVYGSPQDTLTIPLTTSVTTPINDNSTDSFWTSVGADGPDSLLGRLNNCGVWLCDSCVSGNCTPYDTWEGFSKFLYIPVSDTFFIGLGADNQERVSIDNVPFVSLTESPWFKEETGGLYSQDNRPFEYWHIFPVYLTQGYHSFNIQGWNDGQEGSFGAEIYHLTRQQLFTVDSNVVKDSNSTIFSTANVANQEETFLQGYSCPDTTYHLDSTLNAGVYSYNCIQYHTCSTPPVDTTFCATSQSCYDPLSDSTVNPYMYGLLGNYRANTSYVYYSTRAETDPTQPTNIRQNGTFSTFAPFWSFNSSGITPQCDTTKWVWNSKLTMFNDKGFEIENTDPLGRYNSGLYGYGKTLPVAVIQNSRYEENAFEGFEDYGYVGDRCDTSCSPLRDWDFSYYEQYIDSTQSHTGRYSIRIDPAVINNIGIASSVLPAPNEVAGITFNKGVDGCDTTGSTIILQNIKTTPNIVLPNFEPLPGTKMLFSAWVKEGDTCNCQSYTNNEVDIIPTDSSGNKLDSIRSYPSGNIIEGWQRYEQVFTLPSNARAVSVVLRATGTPKVYFDDLRIHPFNADMKSFVYDPVSLRLMAELDENNYATFYEYDDDGTLIRVKKETERGIMTIQETRSALYKDQ